jgi:hypothetical protein
MRMTNISIFCLIFEGFAKTSNGVMGSLVGLVMGSLRVVSEARRAMRLTSTVCWRAFRYNDLKEAARDLRRTRALCKFNGGKERRRAVPRLCCRARHVTV